MTAIYEADDDKYIVFKRDLAIGVTDGYTTFKDGDEIRDAVVIRRQDYFASPALAGYAASIAIAIHLIEDPKTRASLQAVADYFQRQSELAAEEGWKLPDL
jgi:hypothetical protein